MSEPTLISLPYITLQSLTLYPREINAIEPTPQLQKLGHQMPLLFLVYILINLAFKFLTLTHPKPAPFPLSFTIYSIPSLVVYFTQLAT